MAKDSFKIRELVGNHPDDEKVVLNDLINKLIEVQIPLGKLEVHNYKDSVKDALKLLAEHEKLVVLLKRRLREEVREEVQKFHKNKTKPDRKMHPNSLENLNKPKK